MSLETFCGDCRNLADGECPKMSIKDVFPNHSTFYTLESHRREEQALRLLANPEDSCFERKTLLTGFGEFTLLELLAEIEERKKSGAPI